ncbi:GSCFA domain-containing protein [Ideonella dechloratans]|uniref:GSCFA domain-containing protein n=2 Tax=Ideonella dechloratans TaxID=36863 RepID=A0A643FAC0_IDEDE|nr:GSCFA domain-containing protein [Ideonella dechloratans]KAB0580848.1 GSCFA domain-containing protein [Ideonella dechloratans]
MNHPYEQLDECAFWAPAVAKKHMLDISELWAPRFRIDSRMKVVTFGSCFAQHIGRALRERGFDWFIPEVTPTALNPDSAARFNYGVFSARTANIYTASLLKQWMQWSLGLQAVPDEVWEKDGRYYDPFRPNIEPQGFESAAEMQASRDMTLQAFKRCILESDVFVFTMGLTESWFNKEHGYEYPMCPGTVAGEFDPARHSFRNQKFWDILGSMKEVIAGMRALNPKLKFLLTVSPVPLTATMSGQHVLVATMESKSILRTVAAALRDGHGGFVDYFPSYEVINAPPFRGAFFEPNLRSVNHTGVAHVMDLFFHALVQKFGRSVLPPAQTPTSRAGNTSDAERAEVVCEEELLQAFSPRGASQGAT